MKMFFRKMFFFLIPITLLVFSGLVLPPTPRASKSLFFANRQKDSLLKNTKDPRIVFIGGSNLSFGLNSQIIKDSLNLNPINTAVHINIGIKYMLENTLQYVRKGDILILAFEYEHFYRSYDYTSDVLLRTIVDVSPETMRFLSFKQGVGLLRYIPKFTLTKFNPSEYKGFKEDSLYSVNSFNIFGDVDAHWDLINRGYQPITIKENFNKDIIIKLKEFENVAKQKEAIVFVTFPCLDELSFENSKEKILLVEKSLRENDFKILGNVQRYIFPKESMFDAIYHLNKNGLDYRTKLFIEDFKKNHNIQ